MHQDLKFGLNAQNLSFQFIHLGLQVVHINLHAQTVAKITILSQVYNYYSFIKPDSNIRYTGGQRSRTCPYKILVHICTKFARTSKK